MDDVKSSDLDFVEADAALVNRVRDEWGEWAAMEMHVDDGFSIAAVSWDAIIGLVSLRWDELPPPLPPAKEGYLDIVEVLGPHRRRGIARTLIEMTATLAKAQGACQIRSWSTNDKKEAIPMWKALGFSLCPVTHSLWGSEIRGYFVAKRLD